MGLEVRLLGRFAVRVDDRPVEVRPGRPRAVLARLALEGGRSLSRDALVEALWADEPPTSAVNVLQVAVSALRRELGPDAVRTVEGGYALGPATVDVVRLLDGVRAGLRAAERGDDIATVGAVGALVSAYDTPLDDIGRQPFIDQWRDAIAERYLAAVEAHCGALVRLGRADAAVHLLPELIAQHPLREGLLEQWILGLAAVGRESEALAEYEAARERIADELGVDPGTRLRAVRDRVLREDLPPQGSAAARPIRTGIASTPAPIIGREAEVAELLSLLDRPEVRFVTLVGPGGIGKTRLAEAVAEAEPDTTSWVSARGARNADALAEAVLDGLFGMRPQGDPAEVLVAAFSARARTVLVLDDLETDELVPGLLARVAGLTVLATARAPVRLPGEVVVRVETLPVHGDGSASARLLVARITRAGRRAEVGAAARAVLDEVAALCDGVPLALELAAAATATIPLEDLPRRLRQGFTGLRAAGRAERHASVSAALAAGFEGLSADGDTLLGAIAIFPGGADAASAGAVAGIPETRAARALEEVDERGLVRWDGDDRRRIRLLVPVRDAVVERLSADRSAELQERFVAHFDARFCAHAWFERTPRTFAAADEVARELTNLRVALDLAAEREPVRFARMIARLAWTSTVLASRGLWHRRRADALAGGSLPDDVRLDLLVGGSATDRELAEADVLADRLRDPARTAWVRFRHLRADLDRGETSGPAEDLRAMVEAAGRAHGPEGPFLAARVTDAEQMVALREGRAEESLRVVDRAIDSAVDEGREVEAILLEIVRIEVLVALGLVTDAGDDAAHLLERLPAGSPWLRASALSLRGVALLGEGRVEAAVDAQRTAMALSLDSPWVIEQLEVLLRWAAARAALVAGDRNASFVVGVWQAAMRRLDLAPWSIEAGLAASLECGGDVRARRAGEQAVRLLGRARIVEDTMRRILDGEELAPGGR